MKIAFYNILGELKNAEQETLLRLKYCIEKQGHELYIIDRNGFVLDDCGEVGKYIEDVDVDFLFTYNTLEKGIITFPDVFSVFFHWSPLGFVANFQSLLSIKYFNSFDCFAGVYERDLFYRIDKIKTHDIPFIGSSVPVDFSLPARRQNNRKLFYVGINFERKLVKMRYEDLFKELDKSKKIEIYGPKEVYGAKNLWADFDCYKGEIPFDGETILKKINQAGICLAINSPMHNDANGVSNRIYEAAAAGALIISDDNEFVRSYFKDSVFYLNKKLSEKECAKKILEILDWANSHIEEAYEMSKKSNEIFLKYLALDSMVKETVSSIHNAILDIKKNPNDIIDIICFINTEEDFSNIKQQLKKQYYQNINLIIVANYDVYEKISKKISYNHSFVLADVEYKGKSFYNALPLLKGRHFMFMDGNSVLHKRHIYKNLEILNNFDVLFSYSGCYIKSHNGYVTLNSRPILRDEFLFFSNINADNWHYKDMQCFFIETIFSRSCVLFSKEILGLITEDEIDFISDSLHYYLACCSIIKAQKLGRFTYACTAGYFGDSLDDVNNNVFSTRKHWYSNCRSAKTYIKEMNEAFFKYNFEISPDFVPHRDFFGESCWFSDKRNQNIVNIQKLTKKERQALSFINKNKLVKNIMLILTYKKKKKYPIKEVRFLFHLKKHHLLRNLLSHLSKERKSK